MTRPVQPKWIALANALKKITANSVLDDFAAADLIGDGLSRGKLRARAVSFEVCDEEADTRTISPRPLPTSGTQSPADVNKSLFVGGGFGISFWEEILSSRQITFCSQEGCIIFDGLELHQKDFQKHIRNSLSWDIAGVMKGRPRTEIAWARFLIKSVRLERDGQLTKQIFPTSKALLNEIRDELEGIGIPRADLDVRTLKPYVHALWNELVCDHSNAD